MKKTPLLVAALGAAVALTARAESVTYSVDPSHTSVVWEALHMGTSSLRGRFDVKEGSSVTVDRAARTGKADINIDLGSLNTPVKGLENALRSERGFNVASSPAARFAGERFTFDGDRVSAIDGTLTAAGKSVPVTLRAVRFNCYDHPMLKREVCGGDFEGSVSRSALGVNLSPGSAPDAVKLLVQIEAIRQQ